MIDEYGMRHMYDVEWPLGPRIKDPTVHRVHLFSDQFPYIPVISEDLFSEAVKEVYRILPDALGDFVDFGVHYGQVVLDVLRVVGVITGIGWFLRKVGHR